jgi:DNA adenine methylase
MFMKKSSEQKSPFRYAGGKFYARSLILEHVPKHECYIEPMCGGASIFFAKDKVNKNVINDKDPELVNCLIQIRDNPEKIADFLHGIPASKEKHGFFKNEFKPKNDIERAARWFYLNRTSYSGIMNMKNCFWGYGDKYSMRPENWRRHLLATSEKLRDVEILNKDFQEVIENSPDGAFIFLDPPYFNRDQDKFYAFSFSKDDHKRLMETLKKHAGRIKFLVTYDDEPEIREMYEWAKQILSKEWNYMIYRTDDQTKNGDGKDKKHAGKRYKGQEIFILNYKSIESPKLDAFIKN